MAKSGNQVRADSSVPVQPAAPTAERDLHGIYQELQHLRGLVQERDSGAARSRQWFSLAELVIRGLRIGFWIYIALYPLQVVEHMTRDVAGKQTSFSGSLKVSVAVSALLSIGWSITGVQSHRRKGKIKKLRERSEALERQLALSSADGGE
jgi:hypothetical protein